MTYSSNIRNLRDGSIVIKDGTTPTALSCTVVCDEGDLSWSIRKNYQVQYCRGVPTDVRKGNDENVEFSFTTKVAHLISYSVNTSDAITPYEILQNVGDTFTTVGNDDYAVTIVFTISDPASGSTTDETVTFAECYITELSFGEGEEADTLAVSGFSLEEAPTIARA